MYISEILRTEKKSHINCLKSITHCKLRTQNQDANIFFWKNNFDQFFWQHLTSKVRFAEVYVKNFVAHTVVI